MKVTVTVLPKPTVLDPQGAATAEAMHHLGLPSARGVRVGKSIQFETEPVEESLLHIIARDLLSNPVMEDYTLAVER
jgi:phosphoribosylformylglycinamidine synthase PurS subunit